MKEEQKILVSKKYYVGGDFLCSSEDSHFAPQNKEENPLLTRGFAFCSAKLRRIHNG